MIVAGVMSGTSADGVDVALVRVTPREDASPRLKLLGHAAFPFPKKLREAVLAAMDSPAISTADLARLHWRLGEVYGDAVGQAQQQLGVRAQLVGVHGQTIYHQGAAQKYLGKPLRCTWQLGEAAEVAARTGLPVVSDFRPSDMVVGGQGAPLVPMFDRVMFAHAKRNRILQNLGGIANMTALPAASHETLAFDSGPANMVIDACMQRGFGRKFDRNGAVAVKGRVLQSVVDSLLHEPYFAALPPKSCGREEFGEKFVDRFIKLCGRTEKQDIIATATAFTAQSILDAYRNFVWPFLGQRAPLADGTDYIVAGGGAGNATLMRMLRDGLEPLGIRILKSEDFGVPPQAKEAMAFALLAWLRWNQLPGNVPGATGAKREAILGKVTLA
ncbi:MAG: anhydro-N-acetylmuramic acid kinase [Acidobacteria bacterium]|nr:anhydro-N-acetylmuramic acid kinase [Acidobacteriota bacterium]